MNLIPPNRRGVLREHPWAMLMLDGAFLATMGVFICLAPCGYWKNRVMRTWIWFNADPGGPYVVSSLYLFGLQKGLPFQGHPGLVLQVLIGLIARGVYNVQYLMGGREPFMAFWAKHIRWLFVVAGVMVAFLHVVSFHMLYAYARRFLEDSRAAFLCVLGYATLFPTLYFGTRIAPEPIMAILVLAMMLALWEVQEALTAGRTIRAYLLVGLASLASVAAVLTKFHLALPLPGLALLQILLQRGGQEQVQGRQFWKRLGLATWFVICAAAFMHVGSRKIDWPGFFQFWLQYMPGRVSYEAHRGVLGTYTSHLGTMIHSTWIGLIGNIRKYGSIGSAQSLFTLSESTFVILTILGLIGYWATYRQKRGLLLWPALYCLLLLPVVAGRGMWHYFFIHLMLGSVFFGLVVRAATRPMSRWGISEGWQLAGGAVLVLLIHSVAIVFFVNSKLYDVKAYQANYAGYHQALDHLKKGRRIAVLANEAPAFWMAHGGFPTWMRQAGSFHRTFNNQFVTVTDPQQITADWVAKKKVQVVLDLRDHKPNVAPIKRRKPGHSKRDLPTSRAATLPG